eukprot:402297-Pelagomonas_calceolata.AAC.1
MEVPGMLRESNILARPGLGIVVERSFELGVPFVQMQSLSLLVEGRCYLVPENTSRAIPDW